MRHSRKSAVFLSAAILALATIGGGARAASTEPSSTPRAHCGPGSLPETGLQGRVSAADVASGRALRGYRCNAQLRGHFGVTGYEGGSGGYKVFRYVDAHGHECAYYDSTLLFPVNAIGHDLPGVFVLDMKNPSHPVRTATLTTPSMLSPHESLSFNAKRGLLAAGMGNPTTYPGVVNIYDLTGDCRHPQLRSSLPLGILGHEGNFSPDGKTLWISDSNNAGGTMTAIDVSDPSLPRLLWLKTGIGVHGMNISNDGKRVYYADLVNHGMTILDTSQIQDRKPNPQVSVISRLTWNVVSIPQNAIPFTSGGHRYVLEFDEFSKGLNQGTVLPPVGAARIINIDNERRPFVKWDLRLQVNQAANYDTVKGDAGATNFLQGYTAHYCSIPTRLNPTIVACSFILSGLRVFDIHDLTKQPREIAYFNMPVSTLRGTTAYAMSAPTFVPARDEIWYTDGNSGFYNIHLTNGVWPR